jgi:hypothetical protein
MNTTTRTTNSRTWTLMFGAGSIVTDCMGARRFGWGVVFDIGGYGNGRLERLLNPCRTPPKQRIEGGG